MPTIEFYEDFYPGLRMESDAVEVTREEIIDFASRWDPQPYHLDDEAAANSVFGRISACSAHIFALANSLTQDLHDGNPPRVIAGLGFEELRMIQPVFAGDRVRFCDEVVHARPSGSRPGAGIVTSHGKLINQDGQVVFTMKTSFLMERRTSTSPPG